MFFFHFPVHPRCETFDKSEFSGPLSFLMENGTRAHVAVARRIRISGGRKFRLRRLLGDPYALGLARLVLLN